MRNLFATILALTGFSAVIAQTQSVGVFTNSESSFNGYTLYAPIPGFDTYLINNCGEVVNQWNSDYRIGLSAYLLEDGSLLRTGQLMSSSQYPFSGGGLGGMVERFNWEGELIWNLNWTGENKHHHHDIEMMPNGNLLLIAWELHSYEEAIAMGKDSTQTENPIWCCQITEIEPTGNQGGNVVWSWSAWDHLIQDTDPNKPNYGVVAENPRKFNINFTNGNGPNQGAGSSDWMHCNSIDYNAELDQIMISSAKFCELWIIDHNLSTEEAATDAGDLLYRWGNPRAYDRGTNEDQVLFHQHDTHWMNEGVMLFNNGKNRPEGEYSTVEIIDLPEMIYGTYPIDEEQPFQPESYSWRYPQEFDADFYSQNISGAERLPNGNTLICEGSSGHLFEVTADEELVWDYISPITAFGATTQGEDPGNTSVFRTYRYAPDYQAFEGRDMEAGGVIELNSWINSCSLAKLEEEGRTDFKIYPNPTIDGFNFTSQRSGIITVYNSLGQIVETVNAHKRFGLKLKPGYYTAIFTDSETGKTFVTQLLKK
ncbi:MAG: aryl-sulfate sulfotransferase [Bacteroidota bacterium]|nr:aryl-sulfate sulfotransferase [Bacteroidota bacterium]